jgi:hypothetical protein
MKLIGYKNTLRAGFVLDKLFQNLGIPVKIFDDASYEIIRGLQETLRNAQLQHWLQYDVVKWTWWFNLFWSIFPIIIWWKYIDRQRFLEITAFGLLIDIIVIIHDVVGSSLLLWDYPNKFIPVMPNMLPIDFAAIPLAFMLIYQKYQAWKTYFIAVVILSAVLSFIGDPILVWLNLYQPLSWKHYYTFPTFIGIALFTKWVLNVIMARDANYGGVANGN